MGDAAERRANVGHVRIEARREDGDIVRTDMISALPVLDGFSIVMLSLKQKGKRRPTQNGAAIFHGTAAHLDELIDGLATIALTLKAEGDG